MPTATDSIAARLEQRQRQELQPSRPANRRRPPMQRRGRDLAGHVDDAERAGDLSPEFTAGEDAADVGAGLRDDRPGVARAARRALRRDRTARSTRSSSSTSGQ